MGFSRLDGVIENCIRIKSVEEKTLIRVVCTVLDDGHGEYERDTSRHVELYYTPNGRLVGKTDPYFEDEERVEHDLEDARRWGYKG